jgi:hypothetical protein
VLGAHLPRLQVMAAVGAAMAAAAAMVAVVAMVAAAAGAMAVGAVAATVARAVAAAAGAATGALLPPSCTNLRFCLGFQASSQWPGCPTAASSQPGADLGLALISS